MTAVGRRNGDDNKLTRLWPALSHQPKLQVLTMEWRRKVQQERYLLRTSLPLHNTQSTKIPIHPGQFYFIFLFWSGLFWSCCGGLMSSLSTQYGLSLSGILMSSPLCLLLFSKIRAQSAEKLSECPSKSGQTDNTVTTRAIKKSHNSKYRSIVSQIVFRCPSNPSSSGRPIIWQSK